MASYAWFPIGAAATHAGALFFSIGSSDDATTESQQEGQKKAASIEALSQLYSGKFDRNYMRQSTNIGRYWAGPGIRNCSNPKASIAKKLTTHHIKGYSRRRRPEVEHRDRAFHLVMTRLMKNITECHDTGCLPREIHRKPRCAAGKDAGNRIQFLAAVSQIISSHNKIGRAECRIGRKQKTILAIPESMAGSLR